MPVPSCGATHDAGVGRVFHITHGPIANLPIATERKILMEDSMPSDGVLDPQRERWVFDFSLDGDLRFISHRDTLRLFHRALARASLPVSFSRVTAPI